MANFFDQFDAPSSSGNFFDQFDEKPEAPKPEGGLIASLKQTVGQGIKGAGQAAADYLPGVTQDNALKSYGQEVIDANPTAVRSLSDVADSPWTATKEAVGNALGSMGAMVGAQALGRGVEAVAPFTGPARPIVSLLGKGIQFAGPVATAALPSYGGIREQQIQDDPTRADSPEAKARALAGAGAVGLIERSFGPEKLALSAMTKEGRAKVIESMAGKSLAGSIGKGMAKGAAVEGAEELVQNPVEQFASYQDPTTAENIEETLFGGAMGALGGGVLGGAGGGISYAARPEQPQVDPNAGPLSRAAATAQQTGAAGLAQAAQQAQAAEGDTQAAQPDADPLAGLSARLTPEAMRAVRAAEGYGPESVNEVLRAYQIARNPEMDATVRQQATEALNGFWQGFDAQRAAEQQRILSPRPDVIPAGSFGQMNEFADLLAQERADLDQRRNPPPFEEMKGVEAGFDPMSRARNQVPPPSGSFASMNEFADLLGQEQADVQQRRDGIAQTQGLQRDSRLESIGNEINANRQQQTAQARLSLLDQLDADPETVNLLPRFESMLKKQGYAQRRATPEERELIARRMDARAALVNADQEPVAPNELDAAAMGIRERQPKVRQPQQAPAAKPARAAFPMTQTGAQRQAAERTQATGQAFEVVPHPTVKGRFAVQASQQAQPTELNVTTGAEPAPSLASSGVTLTNEGGTTPTSALLNSGEIGTQGTDNGTTPAQALAPTQKRGTAQQAEVTNAAGSEQAVSDIAAARSPVGADSAVTGSAGVHADSGRGRPQGTPEGGAQESGQGVGDDLRTKLQAVERDILAAAPPKFSVGGGDIEGAMRSLKVPKALKEQRKTLKEQVRAAQQPRSDLDTIAERVTEPTHADPGEAPEAATAPVIREAIQKSARNTPLDVKQAKATLLADIDRAIENVPPANHDMAADLAQEKARKFKVSERVAKLAKGSMRDKLEREEGAAFEAMQADRIAKTAQMIGFVTLDVPGDGKFKVVNTVENLQAFRDKVKASPGFREDPTTGMKLDPRPAGPTKKEQSDAITKAVKEGRRTEALDDLGNAIEIARLHGANDDPLLERFREIADQDYDAWRAEQDADGEIAAREAGQSEPAEAPEIAIPYGGSDLSVKLPNPAHEMTVDEVEQVVRDQGSAGYKDTNIRAYRERHYEMVQAALRDGRTVPDEVLADYTGLVRPDLNDDQRDLMIDDVSGLKGAARVKAMREWGKKAGQAATPNSPEPRAEQGQQADTGAGTASPESIAASLDAAKIKAGYQHRALGGLGDKVQMERKWFADAIKKIRADLAPLARNDAQKAKLEELVAKFAEDYKERRYRVMEVGEGSYSAAVAGASNFNNRQAQQRGNALTRAEESFNQWLEARPDGIRAELLRLRTDDERTSDNDVAESARVKKLVSAVVRDLAMIGAIDEGQAPGMDRASFANGAARKIANLHKDGEGAALGKVFDEIAKWDASHKKPLFTARSPIWKYRPSDADNIQRSFAGESARSADTHALATAQSRIAAGEDAEVVRQETGWHKAADGRWRFEIDDSDATILPAMQSLGRGGYDAREIASVTYRKRDDGTYDLTLNPPSPKETSDFVTLTAVRPEVMRAVLPDAAARAVERNAGVEDFIGNFEEAKRIDAAFTFDGFNALPLDQVIDHPALFAAYPALHEVMVQVDPKLGIGGAFSLVESADGTTTQVIRIGKGQQLSTLLHEIQHGIQDIEGFASGGTARQMMPENSKEILARRQEILDRITAAPDDTDVSALWDQLDAMEENPAITAEDRYRRLAGETESRNTQARQKLTAAERRATSPEATADVKASDVIVVFNGTEMASAPAPANAAPMQSTGTTPDAIWSAVESLIGPLRRRRIIVVQSADVLVEQGILQSRDANGAQAFVKDGKAYFIASNIQPGNERAVFLHEVGAHLGMEKILSPLQRSVLLNRIKTWAAQANDSPESRIAQAALWRVEAAGVTGADADAELIAYTVEEAVKAGINPTTDTASPIGQWFKTLWSALRTALEKLGLVNASKLTAQDIVDLAHGAANVAMSEDLTAANSRGMMRSMSERNRVASEQAPNPAGDGMTGGATPLVTGPLPFAPHMSVPVRVISDPSERFISLRIENGHAVMRAAPALAEDKEFIRARGFRAVQRFMWPFDDDVFVRTSDNLKDYEHIKNGTHRGSINHATKETEGGLSVANDTSDAAGKYAYLVRGKVIGQGSDSEPLLELGSVAVVSKRMTLGEMNKLIGEGARKKMQALGLTNQQLIALRVAAQYDFSRMSESSAPAGSGVQLSKVDGMRRGTREQAEAMGYARAYRGVSQTMPFNDSGTVWLTTSRDAAQSYAEEVFGYDDPSVMEIWYDPKAVPSFDMRKVSEEQLEALEPDEFGNPQKPGIYRNSDDSMLGGSGAGTVIHMPKSATLVVEDGGAQFSRNPRIQFSRAAAIPSAEAVSSKARDFLADVVKRPGTFGVLSRTLQTQYHKATKNPQFKAVWTRAHAMFMDASRAMSRPADLAPDLLPKFDLSNMGKAAQAVFGRGQTDRADIKAVADVLSAGTLAGGAGPMEGVVWSDKQLTEDGVRVGDKFVKLTAKQLKLYKEARAAIDASLDESAAAEAWKLLRRHTTDADMRNWIAQNPQDAPGAVADTLATVIEQETAKLEELQLAAEANPSKDADKAITKQQAVIADLKDTEQRTAAIFDKAATLKEAGYMPLMRFGQFRIAVTTPDGKGEKIAYVSRYESAFEANRARRQLMQDFPASEGFTVGAVEVTDQDAWKQFKGVSPETVMLFAKESGIAADEVMQAWYKEAVASRSSLRRMVHRKGYQGFSDDLPRVLASFITSNGKAAGYAYHLADMQQMMQDESMPGDVHREARELLETITQPTEKGANVRGVMASWYLLGSIASAIVNSTQVATMSLPFLSQFGSKGFAPGEAMAHLARAYPQAFGKIKDKALADAVKRAEEAGIVDSNEVFHLYAEAMKPMIAKLGSGSVAYRARAFMTLWGAPFAIVEKLNRKSTFIAAYTMAKAQGKTDAQAFDFGERAVTETQGIYAVHNRPNWARGTVGGAILTFRQFSISYLELAARMWQSGPEGKKAAGLMIGILFLTAGLSGLPGEDDLLDLIDTFSQTFLGKSTVSKMELRNWLNDTMGKELGAFVNSGVSAFLPLDVSGRMGMGNLLPGTALFKPSEPDPKREMLEVLGVPGSFAMSAIDGAKLAMQGDGTAAIKAFAPKAVQDVVKGAEMLRTGEARDLRGRKIVDVGVADAFWQSIGFNPSVKAEAGRRAFEVNEMIGYNKRKESEIVGRLARGVADRDQDAIQSAQQDLVEWNQRNPETPILINRRQVQQRIMQLQMERSGRIVKMAPPELRRRVSEALEEE